jgi:hypothetical protein
MTSIALPPDGMIPAGYMAMTVAKKPDCPDVPGVEDVYSVAGCVSKYFADYISSWKHNGWWLFDSPDIIRNLAREKDIDLSGMQLFYYEVYSQEFEAEDKIWYGVDQEHSIPTDVQIPATGILEGYDVVIFSAATSPEHSPLSCNSLAAEVPVNRHCLLNSFEEAKALLEEGKFNNSEPGPFRIFTVYSLPSLKTDNI